MPFWFPSLDVPAAFDDASKEANKYLAADANENIEYHSRFRKQLGISLFPFIRRAEAGSGCDVCKQRPKLLKSSHISTSGFEAERPDFQIFLQDADFHAAGSNAMEWWK